MKKVGDLLTALGIVGFLPIILEAAGLKIFKGDDMIFFFFIIGSLVLILFGVVIRSIGKSKENKTNN